MDSVWGKCVSRCAQDPGYHQNNCNPWIRNPCATYLERQMLSHPQRLSYKRWKSLQCWEQVSWKDRTHRLRWPACKLVLWKILWRFQLTIQTQTPKGSKVTLMSNLPMAKKWIKTMLYLSIQWNIIYPQKNEIWSLTATGMAQEDIALRDQNRAQKDACHMFSNINVDLMEVDNGVTAIRAWEWSGWGRDGERMVNTSRELSGMRNGFQCSKANQSNYYWQLSISRQQQVDRMW